MAKKLICPYNIPDNECCKEPECPVYQEREKPKQAASVVHINTWEEFKSIAVNLQPKFVAFARQIAPLSRPPLGLRLIFGGDNVQYVFLDFANGSTFRRTKLSVHKNEKRPSIH
jgi:hypothetical protein